MTTIVDFIVQGGQGKQELWLIFKNTYGREPTSEELQTFEAYLRLIGKWT